MADSGVVFGGAAGSPVCDSAEVSRTVLRALDTQTQRVLQENMQACLTPAQIQRMPALAQQHQSDPAQMMREMKRLLLPS